MFWNEDDSDSGRSPATEVVDILFAIECRSIPVDHAYRLSAAVQQVVPWMTDEPLIGVHSIHVAGSQNGWERPTHEASSTLMVSKRTKLAIRAPASRADALMSALQGAELDIAGHPLRIGPGKLKPLSQETTIFARYVASGSDAGPEISEERFLEGAARALGEMDIRIRKALCGKSTTLQGPDGGIHTRSLLLSGLTKDESIRLQVSGLGPYRRMGCGIFIPHKGIAPVGKSA